MNKIFLGSSAEGAYSNNFMRGSYPIKYYGFAIENCIEERGNSMEDVILFEGTDFNLKVEDKGELFSAMTDILVAHNKVTDKSKFIEALYKREEAGVTGMENEIAIPHGKSSSVTEPTVLFCKLENSIQYESLVGDRVSKIFMIAVPEESNNEHLRIISTLARKMMNDAFVSGLDSANTIEDFKQLIEEV